MYWLGCFLAVNESETWDLASKAEMNSQSSISGGGGSLRPRFFEVPAPALDCFAPVPDDVLACRESFEAPLVVVPLVGGSFVETVDATG